MTTATAMQHSTLSTIKNSLYHAAFVGRVCSSLASYVKSVLKDRILPYSCAQGVTLKGDPVDVIP